MMPIARVLVATALLCMMPLQGAVAAAYKWVDDKGETHYSQVPPAATKVEVIKTPSRAPSAPSSAPTQTGNNAPGEPAGGSASSSDATKAEDTAIRTKNCGVARKNLAALKNPGEVAEKGANGLLHTLTSDERKSRSEQAEKDIAEFCNEKE